MKDAWGTDNPLRVGDEDEAGIWDEPEPEPDPDEWLDMRHRDYDGSMIDDCAAIADLGHKLQAQRAAPPVENLFDRARRLNQEKADDFNKRGWESAKGGYYGV
jgi:hypothetical protein